MKKVKSWVAWDWKSISGVILILIIVSLVLGYIYFGSGIQRNSKIKQLGQTITTIGKVVNVEQQNRFSQGKTGNHLSLDYITVEYSYSVNGVDYYKKDKIDNSIQNREFIDKLYSDINSPIKVIYSFENPNESLIDVSNSH